MGPDRPCGHQLSCYWELPFEKSSAWASGGQSEHLGCRRGAKDL
ncbi:hypothetical protein AKJ16_DCAP10403 [Drosera capensis]